MRRVLTSVVMCTAGAALVAASGCRDLHVHVHLPPKQAPAAQSPAGPPRPPVQLHIEQDADTNGMPALPPAIDPADDRQTPAEILEEVFKELRLP